MNEKVLIITNRELKQQAFPLHLLDWEEENERAYPLVMTVWVGSLLQMVDLRTANVCW